MATWGSQTWGFANWGTLGDATIELSGQSIQSNQGSVTTFPSVGWGALAYGAGEWGELASPEAIITGQSLTVTSATVTAFTDFTFEATGIELAAEQGNELAGISQVIDLTGIELTSNVGNEFAGELVVVPVSSVTTDQWGEDPWSQGQWGIGDGISSQTGTVLTQANADVNATGSEISTAIEGVVAGTSAAPVATGIELTSELGEEFAGPNVEIQVTSPSADEWGEDVYGIGTWGVGDGTSIQIGEPLLIGDVSVSVTGVESTLSEGTVDPAPDAMVTGVGMTITSGVGTVTASASVNTTGSEATVETGSPILIGTANIDVTGVELTGSTGQLEYEAKYLIGSVEATSIAGEAFGGEVVEVQVRTASAQPWGNESWGNGEWGQSVGTDIAIGADTVLIPSIDVPVTGIDINSTAGTVGITADANLSLTGQELELLQGDENAFSDVNIEVSGQELTTELDNVVAGISQLIIPTGVTATVTNGTMGVNAWAVVDPNASSTWSVVDKAAA